MSRALLSSASLCLLVACSRSPTCEDGEVLSDDGKSCVPAPDTDPLPTVDTADDAVLALLTLEWQIARLPNQVEVSLRCDGREIFHQDTFSAKKSYVIEKETFNGAFCEVVLRDGLGGELPRGRFTNCSKVIAEWGPQRGREVTVAASEVLGCRSGCLDPVAENYSARANLDDGSCLYINGCTDPRALNHQPTATRDDGSCYYGGFGFIEMNVFTDQYPADTNAYVRCDGFDVISKTNFTVANSSYYLTAQLDAGFDCDVIIGDDQGDVGASGNISMCGQELAAWGPVQAEGGIFGPYERVVHSFFMQPCSGCTDPLATNFDPAALLDDGTCDN